MLTSEIIKKDLVSALKSGKAEIVLVLRSLISAIHNQEIDLGKSQNISEQEIISVIQKEAKKYKEAILAYKSADRQDLLQKEEFELKIIEKYLPAQLSDKKLQDIVFSVIKKTGATSPADFGKTMGMIMKETKGKADGNRVKTMVEKALAKK